MSNKSLKSALNGAAPEQAADEVLALYERVSTLVKIRSYGEHENDRSWDLTMVTNARDRQDVGLLRFYDDQLFKGCTYMLSDAHSVYIIFEENGFENPGEMVTEKTVRVYRALENSVWNINKAVDEAGILSAAMVNGNDDETSLAVMEVLVRERTPVDGKMFVELFDEMKTVNPSVASGLL